VSRLNVIATCLAPAQSERLIIATSNSLDKPRSFSTYFESQSFSTHQLNHPSTSIPSMSSSSFQTDAVAREDPSKIDPGVHCRIRPICYMCSVWQRIQYLELSGNDLERRLSKMPDPNIDDDLFGQMKWPTWRRMEDAERRKDAMAHVIISIDEIKAQKAPLWTEFDQLRKDHGLDKVKRY